MLGSDQRGNRTQEILSLVEESLREHKLPVLTTIGFHDRSRLQLDVYVHFGNGQVFARSYLDEFLADKSVLAAAKAIANDVRQSEVFDGPVRRTLRLDIAVQPNAPRTPAYSGRRIDV